MGRREMVTEQEVIKISKELGFLRRNCYKSEAS